MVGGDWSGAKMEWAHTTPTRTNTTRKTTPQEFRKGKPHKHGHTHKNSETVHDRPTQTAKLRKKFTRRSANKRKPAAAAGPKQQTTTTGSCKQKNEINALAGLRIQWQKTRETGRKPEGGEAEDLCNSSDDENKQRKAENSTGLTRLQSPKRHWRRHNNKEQNGAGIY